MTTQAATVDQDLNNEAAAQLTRYFGGHALSNLFQKLTPAQQTAIATEATAQGTRKSIMATMRALTITAAKAS